ncbi:IS21-like element helper ATPase IstB [Fusibacter ferrireducens]|uniref:ATP-binding protein n=1 Tax=Fusibacter ferrireducens TaxID=2785058 RepID=A0ABR9ZP48_9FIRM|nr:IS21-like element helper ATPase IstB [Fusibacter ferrireducens]MBF4692242.1 ATP-binding protein [Fusibacter ferrireducens]
MSIERLAIQLKLPYIKAFHEEILAEALHTNMTHEEFLTEILIREAELRRNNGIKTRIRQAKFPYFRYLEDFSRNKYHREFWPKFDELEKLEFIEKKENIILIGTPGSGKTHYSIGLAMKAILEGKSVLFVSVPNLVIELKEALSQHQLNSYKRKFEKYDLVILDELGYITFDKSGSEILFNLLSNRNDKGSIVITTNLSFERWNEVFGDTLLTGALVDRLAHKAHILDISLENSVRFEETMAWLKTKE